MSRRFWDRISGKEALALSRALDESIRNAWESDQEFAARFGRMLPAQQFTGDFRRILADYNRSVLEAKSPAARGKLAAPAFYTILEAARLHGIQPLGTESLGEQGTKERKESE